MSEKQIHIVFQVLNFILSIDSKTFALLSIDKLLLLALAKHQGPKGIYPSTITLAKELQVSPKHIKERINYLDDLKVIEVERKIGCVNRYKLTFTDPNPSPTGYQSPLGDQSPTGTRPVTYRLPDPSPTGDTINTYNQNRLSKQREAQKSRSLSLSNFSPEEQNQFLCRDLRLDLQEEITSFKNRHSGSGNLQYEFSRWLKRSAQYRQERSQPKEEVRCTVPEFGPGHPTWEMFQAIKRKKLNGKDKSTIPGNNSG